MRIQMSSSSSSISPGSWAKNMGQQKEGKPFTDHLYWSQTGSADHSEIRALFSAFNLINVDSLASFAKVQLHSGKRTREQADSFLSGLISVPPADQHVYSSWTRGDQSLWWLLINSLNTTSRTSHLLPHATDIRSWWLRIGWRGSDSLLVKNNDCTTR